MLWRLAACFCALLLGVGAGPPALLAANVLHTTEVAVHMKKDRLFFISQRISHGHLGRAQRASSVLLYAVRPRGGWAGLPRTANRWMVYLISMNSIAIIMEVEYLLRTRFRIIQSRDFTGHR